MRILVADDDEFFLRLICDTLRQHGFEVEQAQSGPETLTKALDQTPDLIVVDVVLPGLQGTDVSQRLRKDDRTAAVPILLMSGRVSELIEATRRFEDFLADDFLRKPFKPTDLLDKVNRLIGTESKHFKTGKTSKPVRAPWVEKRLNPRLPIDIEVSAKTAQDILYHPAINISTGGVCIRSPSPLDCDRILDLRFPIPGQDGLIATEGVVSWCRESADGNGYELGVRFRDLSQADRQRIQDYINALLGLIRPAGVPTR